MTDRLSRELIDQVVFGMENQERVYYLDIETSTVVADDDLESGIDIARHFEVPEWRSVDGFNLMEKFVGLLHNPIFRERLRQILASGRGVFRQFKDALKDRPEIERLWFSFKEREMQRLVVEWYNDLREQWGLERLELEIEETEQLIASDFVFVVADGDLIEFVEGLDRVGFAECYPDQSEELVDLRYEICRSGVPSPADPRSRVIVAETPGGDSAGFVWAVVHDKGEARLGVVVQLFVVEEYRGLGLAKALVRDFLVRADGEGVTELIVEMPGTSGTLVPSLEREGMVRDQISMRVNTRRWARENTA